MTSIGVRIPESLKVRIEVYAVDKDKTISEVVREAIEEYLDKEETHHE